MGLATLTSKELAKIQRLIERKEALAQQITEINGELAAMDSGSSDLPRRAAPTNGTAAAPKARRSAAPALPRKKGKAGRTVRGQLKQTVAAQLKAAGNQGMKVKDLAAKLGTSYGNVTAFFQSTGKKMKEIKKVGPAQFAWTGA